MRVVIIGGGPTGVAAAIGAADRGHRITLLEREELGASLQTWGPARFFSPLGMNLTPRMREILGGDLPATDALLTGQEYVERVLRPLADRPPLAGRVFTRHRVIAIGRRGLTRSDYAGHPLRSERPFSIIADTPEGESELEADAVLDATGGLRLPRPFGMGGLPARGERQLDGVIRTLGELWQRRDGLRGKRVLVVGDGHSAANAIGMLAQVAADDPGTKVVWVVRTPNRRPCEEVSSDPLPERRSVVARANDLASSPPPFLRLERRAMIEAVSRINGHLSVSLSGGRSVEVDHVAAFTGYRPDASHLQELAVEISPVTEGGARLYRAIANVRDCLSIPAASPEDLESGEPGYWFVGSRAYGRSSSFLLNTGFAQLEVILDAIGKGAS